MSSGLYVPSRDIAYPAPGVGVSPDGRLCSGCHQPSRSQGGGLIAGRWYCCLCKPKKETTMVPLSRWMKRAHDHCLRTGAGITPAEAVRMFGVPASSNSPSSALNSALRNGWFRRDEWTEQGATGLVRRSRYFAVDREATPARVPDNRSSYFTGLKRCRSVFELGSAL